MKVPQALCAALLTKVRDTILRIPLPRPHALWTHARSDLNRMVVLLCNSPHDRAIPFVSIAPPREDSGASFEGHMCSRRYLVATDVSINHELAHVIGSGTMRYVRQDGMEGVQLCTACLVLYNAPIFSETSEVKVLCNKWMYNERCTTRRWR